MTLPENVLAQARGHWRTMLVASHCNIEWSFELSLKFLGGVVADTLGWRRAVRWLENFSPDLGYKTVGLSGSIFPSDYRSQSIKISAGGGPDLQLNSSWRNFSNATRFPESTLIECLIYFLHQDISQGASLVAQGLRICLPMQGIRVRALLWEDPTCRRATRPVGRNC